MDRDLVVQRLREYFATGHEHVVAVYLFGSLARGTAKPTSDVDVALLCDRELRAGSPLPHEIASALSDLLDREVDVVLLDTAPADLVHEVLRWGILADEKDRSRRIAFEIAARNRYFDLLPMLARYRRISEQAFD